ncbi:MAG: hypothetical protein Q7R66_13065 [Undibacterium sp.]|uniref:hypothetical protein n=1 Tax=Undibacterium sp. TaxID=1914977 RepID=UPI00271F05A2|nr:hypothetical protein [Undibacterium sp.]MDO8653108.1 hypothetical protein [Undibacterium sp.]
MTSLTKIVSTVATVLALASSISPALAHDDAYLDTLKSANGGQVRMAGVYHFELVMAKDSKDAKEKQIMVYVTDHAGTKIPTAGATANATILSGKTKTGASLVPDGDNRLKGSAKYIAGADTKVVLSVSMPGKPAEQARYTPFAIGTEEHMHH